MIGRLKLKAPLMLLLTLGLATKAEDLTTLDHKTYRGIRVVQTNALALGITYPGGSGWINFTNLSRELQTKYGYDAARAEALLKKREKTKTLGRLGACYRLSELAEAQAEARRDGKPLAFLATFMATIQATADMTKKSGAAATVHVFEALKNAAVIVYSDSDKENHTEPPIVDHALHTPDSHYTAPRVIITDAEITKVIFVIPYNGDFATRQKLMAEALQKITAARPAAAQK